MGWFAQSSQTRRGNFKCIIVSALLLALAVSPNGQAADKAHLVVISIDDSGSMLQSDPERFRLEAVTMLARSGATDDQVAILKFGESAAWLLEPTRVSELPSTMVLSKLSGITSSDRWTNLAAPLKLAQDYVDSHSDFVRNYDVSIVLLTDGKPDPGPSYAGGSVANRESAVSISRALASRGIRIYAIGLGSGIDSAFLEQLATTGGGTYVPAKTAPELMEAFLRAITRIFSLPAYDQSKASGTLQFRIGNDVEMARIYLFRKNNGTQLSGSVSEIVTTNHVAVYDIQKPSPEMQFTVIGNSDGASAILCVRQPLTFESPTPIPPALLVNNPVSVELAMIGGRQPLWDRLFMRDASVGIRLTRTGEQHIASPLYPDPIKHVFRGALPSEKPGEFEATVVLESSFGEVRQFLRNLRIVETAVSMPAQIRLEYPSFIPFARRWFGADAKLTYTLSTGTARVLFSPANGISPMPSEIQVAPGRPAEVTFVADEHTDAAATAMMPATILWSDGKQTEARKVAIVVELVPQSPAGFVRAHWFSSLALLVLVAAIYKFWPRTPKLVGVLLIDESSGARKRVELDQLKTSKLTDLPEILYQRE